MRTLITTIDATSHLRILAPVAQAARARGHDVLVAGPAAMSAEVGAGYGLPLRPVGFDWTADATTVEAIGRQMAFGAHDAYMDTMVQRVFLGEPALRAAEDLRPLVRQWRPDVVLRVGEEFGGYLAAEEAGLPHAAVASGCAHVLNAAAIEAPLRRLRAAYGLPDVAAPDPYPHLLASFTPPRYGVDLRASTLRHYQQTQPSRAGDRLPQWLSELPADRPLVFAAFGTVVPDLEWKIGPLVSVVVDALAGLDCVAVVAVGGAQPPPGEVPDNVRIVDRVAQPLLIEAADLFVTHAGFGGVREAMRGGTPMVALPVYGDQPYHAERCARLGVAKVVPSGQLRVAAVRAACAEVLASASYRNSARLVQREILALPPVSRLVDDLEALARARPAAASTQVLAHTAAKGNPR